MAAKKRKADTDIASPATRRQSGRATKARVTYEESDAEDIESGDEFNEEAAAEESDADVQEENSEAPESESADEDEVGDEELNDYERGLKKKGYKKKKGKDGKWSMVIELPEAKHDGGVPYEDKRIHPNTLAFLKDLKKNNDREWLKFHDAVFR